MTAVPQSILSADSILKDLPPELRLGHWYCDLQHAMFLILAHRSERFVSAGRRALAEYYIDMTTVYWVLHDLMEEEGMAFSLLHGAAKEEQVAAHAEAHVALTRTWYRTVLEPFKGGAANSMVAENIQAFYRNVIAHISTFDRETCSHTGTGRSQDTVRREVAHLGGTGLPLSPQVPGSETVMSHLAPRMKDMISPHLFPTTWSSPLPQGRLAAWSRPLWTGGKGAFRDVFARSMHAATVAVPV